MGGGRMTVLVAGRRQCGGCLAIRGCSRQFDIFESQNGHCAQQRPSWGGQGGDGGDAGRKSRYPG